MVFADKILLCNLGRIYELYIKVSKLTTSSLRSYNSCVCVCVYVCVCVCVCVCMCGLWLGDVDGEE